MSNLSRFPMKSTFFPFSFATFHPDLYDLETIVHFLQIKASKLVSLFSDLLGGTSNALIFNIRLDFGHPGTWSQQNIPNNSSITIPAQPVNIARD